MPTPVSGGVRTPGVPTPLSSVLTPLSGVLIPLSGVITPLGGVLHHWQLL